mgnify:CR=1 FL=1
MSRRPTLGPFTASQRAARTSVARCLCDDVAWTRDAGAQADPVVWSLLWRYWTERIGVACLETSTTQWILTLLLLRAPPSTRGRMAERARRALEHGTYGPTSPDLLVHVLALLDDVSRDGPRPRGVWNHFCAAFCYNDPLLVRTETFRRALAILRAETRVEALNLMVRRSRHVSV